MPIMYTSTIKKDGNLSLSEESPFGVLNCEGKVKIENRVVSSHVECENDTNFVQRIDLTEVTEFDTFKAPVFSSLYNATLVMDFKRESEKELTITDIVGTYEVTPRGGDEPDFFVTIIGENNSFSLTTTDPQIASCQGEVTIKNRIVTAVCYNNQSPVYGIDLTGVTEFDHFQAPVSITSYAEDGSVEYQIGGVLDFKRQAPPLILAN